jgi:hypothetical protein
MIASSSRPLQAPPFQVLPQFGSPPYKGELLSHVRVFCDVGGFRCRCCEPPSLLYAPEVAYEHLRKYLVNEGNKPTRKNWDDVFEYVRGNILRTPGASWTNYDSEAFDFAAQPAGYKPIPGQLIEPHGIVCGSCGSGFRSASGATDHVLAKAGHIVIPERHIMQISTRRWVPVDMSLARPESSVLLSELNAALERAMLYRPGGSSIPSDAVLGS